ncbi:uncharacterized protein DSM5745_00102 [Aspergillus mulundensis]|uniref:Uncharacterized protein n=1 Tax=Aspergillus mulundensis TaxID=1810919 RepID=A0A3D8T2L9_9EURO|nr:hypothetical protein DSM5745_00102 [Aspergillus mulundensis]RDW92780.1 hypothetical protein DSM5745_00102 [Aspergillus mulundensis]
MATVGPVLSRSVSIIPLPRAHRNDNDRGFSTRTEPQPRQADAGATEAVEPPDKGRTLWSDILSFLRGRYGVRGLAGHVKPLKPAKPTKNGDVALVGTDTSPASTQPAPSDSQADQTLEGQEVELEAGDDDGRMSSEAIRGSNDGPATLNEIWEMSSHVGRMRISSDVERLVDHFGPVELTEDQYAEVDRVVAEIPRYSRWSRGRWKARLTMSFRTRSQS